MSTRLIILLILATIVVSAAAQEAEKSAVEAVIHDLFKGMEKGDSAMVSSTFKTDVIFVSISRDKQDSTGFEKETSPHEFLKAIGTPHPEIWYEETWNLTIKIDGDFAQAWCDYAFYLTNKFSHCGVDAFHLYKCNGHWKIFQLTDTRRKSPCIIPADIQAKHRQ